MPLNQSDKEDYATKLAITGLFFTVVMFFSTRLPAKRRKTALRLNPFDLALLGIATHRLGRLIAYDKVAEPLRLPFAETVSDVTGAGKTTIPRGAGARRALGELITCPICAGTWIATGLIYGLNVLPRPTRVLVNIMGIAGIAELLNTLVEALSWFGLAERQEVGEKVKG